MPIDLTVNNSVFAYPSPGDEPGWGEPATDWASEVSLVLSTLQNSNDILDTSAIIANNQTLPNISVTGLLFNSGTVRAAVVNYSIDIFTSGTELAEVGTLYLIYKNSGTIGSKWSIGRISFGDDAGVTFTMTDAGQIQYTSSNVAGTGYIGTMNFSAKVTLQ
jgi:hypothetical protein